MIAEPVKGASAGGFNLTDDPDDPDDTGSGSNEACIACHTRAGYD
jgi:hypothetical protein